MTNLPSNTACRAFGAPQSMIICETWIDQIASTCQIPSNQVRLLNFYKEGDKTHYGQVLEDVCIQRIWDTLMKDSDFTKRLNTVQQFNSKSKWKKRGIACLPVKFGMSFTAKFMNQAGALVHVYTDGSVLVTHGGIEMGQGLHTKIAQIAAGALGIPMEYIYINETSTDKVPNTSPTAASVQSDINGMAVLSACQKIAKRLDPVKKEFPNSDWKAIVKKAYFNRIDLSAHGFYKTPDIGFDFDVGQGKPFNYYNWGASCSEVEIDCLTGDYQILRADIVMDVGNSLNPAIDIGQVEGAFVQGVGWCTLEELVYDKSTGKLLTSGPGWYKLPGFTDVPLDFRVQLLKDAPNRNAIHSSKGVGEPPFFLSCSVFFCHKRGNKTSKRSTIL